MPEPVSVVVTVRNDDEALIELLATLGAQSVPPAEIVVVDAGEGDAVARLAERHAGGLDVRVLADPGAGISAGRNRGVEAARHERIAITDAGCRPDPGWLAALSAALEGSTFAAGTYVVEPATPFEHAAAVSLYPDVEELAPGTPPWATAWTRLFGRRFEVDRATGRSMGFHRAAWRAAGGFPEDVDAGEDVTFSAAMVAGGSHALVAEAVVRWRGRPTWRANGRMYRRYATGEAIAGAGPRALVRGLAWVAAGTLALRGGRMGRALAAGGAGAYCALPLRRARRTGLAARHWWRIPLLIALKDLAMLAGTLAGLLERRTGLRLPGSPGRDG